jgi:hypothetical protein
MREKLNRKIRGKMNAIKKDDISLEESGIGYLFNKMKNIDEVLYLELILEYKNIILQVH